jgi:hypothetical protein
VRLGTLDGKLDALLVSAVTPAAAGAPGPLGDRWAGVAVYWP